VADSVALIVCPSEADVERRLLGLTVGERLLLALEKGGVTHAAFAGGGPIPKSSRARLEMIPLDAVPAGARTFVCLPADLVFDSALINSDEISEALPLKRLPSEKWREIADDPGKWLAENSMSDDGENGSGFAIRVADDETVQRAEDALMKSLVKPADGIISRNLNRKISTAISRRLAPHSIKPNHVTAVVFLIGALSGPLAYTGTYLGFVLGAFCYWFSAVLDGCDGELSRLKYQSTPLGAWLDTIVDDMVGLSYVAGMYAALARDRENPFWFWLGIGGVGFYLLTILPRYYIMSRLSGSGDYQKMAKEIRSEKQGLVTRVALKVRDIIFRTDFLPFYALATAAAGLVPAFAIPFAFGSVASSIDTIVTIIRYRPASTDAD
jgi:phosphatidylglycerophosphate synthase